MLFYSYQDIGGVAHPGMFNFLDANIKTLSLPALPFSIAMPALSLLLVFRTNTAYFRWNEARTLWGGLINNCRNVVRQANTFFPDTPVGHGNGYDRGMTDRPGPRALCCQLRLIRLPS